MTGPEHYSEAEALLDKSNVVSMDDGYAQLVVAQAQVHATLALTAATAAEQATAYDGDEDGSRSRGWAGVA